MGDQRPEPSEEPISKAYEQRTKQLYEARGALSEAVSTLAAELAQCREERDKLREYATSLERGIAVANDRTAAVLNMRAVRWTARPRALLHRLRSLRGSG